MKPATKVTMDDVEPREVPMSYAEAKEIALLRLELRACWDRADQVAGRERATRLAQVAGNDNELVAEARRWAAKFG